MGFIRTKLRFSLLKSVLVAIRGERGKPTSKEPYLGYLEYNLIRSKGDYDV